MSRASAKCSKLHRLTGGSGFTLVEVMVALTILSLVMLATVSGFRTLATTQSTLDRTINRIDEIRTVSNFLRQVFESAIVGKRGSGLSLGGDGGGGSSGFFDMDESVVVLKSVVMMGEGFGGTQVVRLAQEGTTIVLRWSQKEIDVNDKRWQRYPSRVLVRDVEVFEISSRPKSNAPWQPRWKESGAPNAVRVVLKAHGRFFPELIIPVQR
ncbi:MAG: prepilin-type N-terminal cleavage/methylation domain-containing protein [Halioglobus sp.]